MAKTSIKSVLNSTKISLERKASDQFGAAVEDFSRGTLGPLIGVPDSTTAPVNRNDGSFYASSYAHTLAGGTSYRPKLKFLFKVEFVFTDEAMQAMPTYLGRESNNDFTFLVRSIDRPKIDFEYQDDVNMYNFRTKVLKKIRHRELTIVFMDDSGNRVLNFFRALMMIYSPITRRQMERQKATGLARLAPPTTEFQNGELGSGMRFSSPTSTDRNDISHRGAVNFNVGSLIQTIRVKQIFVNPQSPSISGATEEVIFDFINARLVSFDFDDLTHEASDPSLMTMQFDYDWMEIIEVGPLAKMDEPKYNIAVPGISGAPVDMTTAGGGSLTDPGGGNTFTDILSNQAGRAVQQLTSEAVSRGVQSIAGKGRFASLIGSQASNIVGGLVGGATRNLTSGIGNSVNQALASPGGIMGALQGISSASTRVIDTAKGGLSDVISVITSKD